MLARGSDLRISELPPGISNLVDELCRLSESMESQSVTALSRLDRFFRSSYCTRSSSKVDYAVVSLELVDSRVVLVKADVICQS